MDGEVTPNRGLKAVIEAMGSQVALASLIQIGQPAVSKWLAKGAPLPAEYVLMVERETGISRHDIRPDLYPLETKSMTLADHPGAGSAR